MAKFNLQGREVDGLEIRFKSVREEWNEYDLEDGTTIKLKAIVSNIVRVEGEYDAENNPVYVLKSANVAVVQSPDNLKKK